MNREFAHEGRSNSHEYDEHQRALVTIVDLALMHGIDLVMIQQAMEREVAQRAANKAQVDATAETESYAPAAHEIEDIKSHWIELVRAKEPSPSTIS